MPDDDPSLFKIGDIIVRRWAKKTPGKIVGVRYDPEERQVTYMVVTAGKRFGEWKGHPLWHFLDPVEIAGQFRRQAAYYNGRAAELEERIEKTRGVV